MKEVILGILDVVTVLITLVLCKSNSKPEKMSEQINELNIDAK